ncbi:MAG: RdgB/HAM1 family non-canonical purine NTP pyrophosphatase [Bowdeniella nasicola]|nr:RdgB/HAM1 family non-canonical purine NTP pyrophosphatase [Bowdeniella nasicola]
MSEASRLILATHNAHKVVELREILAAAVPALANLTVVSAADVAAPEPVEDGATFAQNALIKARAIVELTGECAVADDSGLCVDVMGGAPGIFSARWCGRHGDDRANLELLLAQLSDTPARHRRARFVCAAALVTPGGEEYVRSGELVGTLLERPVGSGGFGYDPILQPEGDTRSLAQLDAAEKNAISHRGRALRALAPQIGAAFGVGA